MILFDKNIFPPLEDKNFWTVSRTVGRNDYVDLPHTFSDTMYVVHSGAIKVGFYDKDKEIILSFAIKNDLVCNFISFLSGNVSNVYLQAIKKTELLGFKKSSFENLLRSDAHFANTYRMALESKIVEILNRHVIQYSSDPKTRVDMIMKHKPDIFQHIPRKYIAHYLGLAPETLSRLQNS